MKFDKTTVIGLVICGFLLFTWTPVCQYFGWLPAPAETAAEKSAAAETDSAAAPENTPVTAVDENIDAVETVAQNAEKTVATAADAIEIELPANHTLRNDAVELTIAADGSGIITTRFLKFRHNDSDAPVAVENSQIFKLEIPHGTVKNTVFTASDENSVTAQHTVVYKDTELQLKQLYTLKDDYIVNCRYSLSNPTSEAVKLDKMVIHGGTIAPWHILSGDKVRTITHRLDYLTADGSLESIDGDDDDDDYFLATPAQVQWAAVSNKYFCSMLKCVSSKDFVMWQENPRQSVTDNKEKEYKQLTIGAILPEMTLPPNSEAEFEFSICTGPKNAEQLAAFAPEGENATHLAWGPLNYLARLLMWLLNLFYSLCGSYGVSIILLTLLVRILFYPLTSKGNESMRKMQKVQPLFKELKEKYKDDPQLLNQKMTELYRKEGINPLAGCFPILLQIPIFFALYAMLDNAIALRHVSFLWAKNLAAADTVCSIPLGFTDLPLNPLVLVMTALMLVQQRMTPMSADPAQKKMMMFMPVIMLVFLYDLPSGLTLYWTVSNIFSIIQLWLQKKRNQALDAAAAGQSK